LELDRSIVESFDFFSIFWVKKKVKGRFQSNLPRDLLKELNHNRNKLKTFHVNMIIRSFFFSRNLESMKIVANQRSDSKKMNLSNYLKERSRIKKKDSRNYLNSGKKKK